MAGDEPLSILRPLPRPSLRFKRHTSPRLHRAQLRDDLGGRGAVLDVRGGCGIALGKSALVNAAPHPQQREQRRIGISKAHSTPWAIQDTGSAQSYPLPHTGVKPGPGPAKGLSRRQSRRVRVRFRFAWCSWSSWLARGSCCSRSDRPDGPYGSSLE